MANIETLAQDLTSRFEVPFGLREFESGEAFHLWHSRNGHSPTRRFSARCAERDRRVARPPIGRRLTVTTLARAFDTGECCAWIDGGGTFDPESAAEAGLQLDRLLWINCKGNPEHALKATDLLLHGGGFGVMVFDLSDIPDSVLRRMPMASWFRLKARGRKDRHCPHRAYSRSADALVFSRVRGTQAQQVHLAGTTASRHRLAARNPQAQQLKKASFESVL